MRIAKEVGLWVVARPGPYICSEWDGGALPSYLLADPDVRLRDNDPAYLRHVSRWFDRILPILRDFQVGAGGTIVCVQLENELDFFGCADPRGYLAALRDLARERGISVPLVACAGQGGLDAAGGRAEEIVPACNFYPYDRDPDFESKVLAYRERLAEEGHPLLVTETNRSHFLLRRLLSCGAKLLGPYLQVSGTDFGFTNATNNWGEPLAFMTSDYDFGGMISPEGRVREEAYEGRLLRRILNAYGSALAEALPADPGERPPGSGIADPAAASCYRLALAGGGSLLFVSQTGEAPLRTEIPVAWRDGIPDEDSRGETRSLTVLPGRCVILPMQVPMAPWGLPGTLEYATTELCDAVRGAGKTTLVLHTETGEEGEVAFRLSEKTVFVEPEGMDASQAGDRLLLRFAGGQTGRCVVGLAGGRVLEVVVLPRAEALLVEGVDETGGIRFGAAAASAPEPEALAVAWTMAVQAPHAPMTAIAAAIPSAGPLEAHGVYRGFAWYEAETRYHGETLGVLVREGSDVVSLYADGRYLGTVAPGGSSRYLPLEGGGTVHQWTARTEIWGHSNFDDIRLPGLRLRATKGLNGLVAVTRSREITSNWRVSRTQVHKDEKADAGVAGYGEPIVAFGGWMSPDQPARETYRKTIFLSSGADDWTLRFDGLQATAVVYVDGREAGPVTPFDPYLNLTPYMDPAATAHELTIRLERTMGLPAGRVTLLEGNAAESWRLSAAEEAELLNHAAAARHSAVAVSLPLRLEPGGVAWAYGALPNSAGGRGWRVRVRGERVKLTVFFAGRIVARLWLPGGGERPAMKGGSEDSFYLPGIWFDAAGGELTVLAEAVHAPEPGVLHALLFQPV
nr:beta-galactosidase [Cohnella sp. REN36]